MAEISQSKFYNEIIGVTLTRYQTPKGIISLCPPFWATANLYEIHCLEGNLLEDIERYDSLEETETRIKELLGG